MLQICWRNGKPDGWFWVRESHLGMLQCLGESQRGTKLTNSSRHAEVAASAVTSLCKEPARPATSASLHLWMWVQNRKESLLLPFWINVSYPSGTGNGIIFPLPVCQRWQLYLDVRKAAFKVGFMPSVSTLVILFILFYFYFLYFLLFFFTLIHLALNTRRLVTNSWSTLPSGFVFPQMCKQDQRK